MATGSGNDLAEDYETSDFSSRESLETHPIFLLTNIFHIMTSDYLSLPGEIGIDEFPPGRNRRHCAKRPFPRERDTIGVRETVN